MPPIFAGIGGQLSLSKENGKYMGKYNNLLSLNVQDHTNSNHLITRINFLIDKLEEIIFNEEDNDTAKLETLLDELKCSFEKGLDRTVLIKYRYIPGAVYKPVEIILDIKRLMRENKRFGQEMLQLQQRIIAQKRIKDDYIEVYNRVLSYDNAIEDFMKKKKETAWFCFKIRHILYRKIKAAKVKRLCMLRKLHIRANASPELHRIYFMNKLTAFNETIFAYKVASESTTQSVNANKFLIAENIRALKTIALDYDKVLYE